MAKGSDTAENMTRCICQKEGCPSYPGGTVYFCAKGKSAEEIRRRGRICDDCQNFKDFDLIDGYYCADGKAGEGAE